ncbi:MAG: hypothetical protein PVH41_06555 [Anaerolineae bacterium]
MNAIEATPWAVLLTAFRRRHEKRAPSHERVLEGIADPCGALREAPRRCRAVLPTAFRRCQEKRAASHEHVLGGIADHGSAWSCEGDAATV